MCVKLHVFTGVVVIPAQAALELQMCVSEHPIRLPQVLDDPNWPETWPFTEQDFQRFDPSSDSIFYDSPRFVTHIDDGAIAALTRLVSVEHMHMNTI